MLTKNEESNKKWSRKKSRGILSSKEREFLLKKRKCSPDMVRYYRSNIVRKTQKAIEDLNLIFETVDFWRIFTFDETYVEKLVIEAVKIEYQNNRGKEIQNRLKRKVKLHVDKRIPIKKTKERINQITDFFLDAL